MKIDKLIEMSKVQLEDELSSYQDSLLNLKFQKSLQQLEDSSQLSKTRRNIAQIKTILNLKYSADYAFSQNLTGIFYFDYSFSEYAISTAFPQTTIRAGFTMRYNFGN